MTMNAVHDRQEDASTCSRGEYAEHPLLLPSWQWSALGRSATRQGLTIGQLLRRLVAAHLVISDDLPGLEESPIPEFRRGSPGAPGG